MQEELTVRVEKTRLTEALKENRQKHEAIFKEAIEGYKKKVTETLRLNLEAIEKGKLERISINLPMPSNHIRDYDRIIKMLEMHQGNVIDIPETDFQRYVMDDWEWRREFFTANAMYSPTAATAMTNGDQ